MTKYELIHISKQKAEPPLRGEEREGRVLAQEKKGKAIRPPVYIYFDACMYVCIHSQLPSFYRLLHTKVGKVGTLV